MDKELIFQALKKWRKAKALELDMPAFVILSDQTLKHLAISTPTSTEQLKLIHGIGDVKAERFGPEILSTLRDF